ncbi:MAG: ferredoxin-thioredoxin reductase catalytic domain-containing protein [Candidatus Heimdallarchaeota archaeon]
MMPPPKKKKTKEEVRKFIEMVAEKQGWHLHPDKEFLEILIEGLTSNFNNHGYFGCPCRLIEGNKEVDSDVLCPCKYCVPDQEEFGHCYCGLYTTPEFHATGKMPQGIPERRPEEQWID